MSNPVWRSLLRHATVLLAGRPLRGRERYRPFFIVGSPRSGTTLLRAVLQAHPAIHIPPETHVLASVVRAWRWYGRFLPWTDLLRVVLARFEYQKQWDLFDLPLGALFRQLAGAPPHSRNLAAVLDALYHSHAARHKPAATRWGDKSDANTFGLSALHAVFPDLRTIHMLRDGRDVVRSFMQVARYEPRVAASRWLAAVRAAREHGLRNPAQHLEIRYEELVRQPQIVLPRVTTFLNLPFDEGVLRHHDMGVRLLDVEQMPPLRGVLEPVHARQVGRWREFFDAGQVADLNRLLGPTLESLGYLERE